MRQAGFETFKIKKNEKRKTREKQFFGVGLLRLIGGGNGTIVFPAGEHKLDLTLNMILVLVLLVLFFFLLLLLLLLLSFSFFFLFLFVPFS